MVNAWQVIENEVNVGASVVIADWRCDWIGLGIAEKLARSGCRVRLAVDGYMPGQRIHQYVRDQWCGRVAEAQCRDHPLWRGSTASTATRSICSTPPTASRSCWRAWTRWWPPSGMNACGAAGRRARRLGRRSAPDRRLPDAAHGGGSGVRGVEGRGGDLALDRVAAVLRTSRLHLPSPWPPLLGGGDLTRAPPLEGRVEGKVCLSLQRTDKRSTQNSWRRGSASICRTISAISGRLWIEAAAAGAGSGR